MDKTEIELKDEQNNIDETQQTSSTSDPYKCVWNGVPMTWNVTSQQWLPDIEVNEDFLAYYNANYGIQYDYDSMPKPEPPKVLKEEKTEEEGKSKKGVTKLTKEQKQLKKREARKRWAETEAARREQGWFEMDEEKNTTVYADGFPSNIDEEEFVKFMSKCGVIQKDPRTGKPKIKLYRTKEGGEPKGDGTCCYVKMESVELALQILDGWQWDSAHKIHVERAKFELKGEFDPTKKRQRLSGAQKKKFLEKQEKIFQWKPDKPRNFRNRCECTVVLRGMFSLEEIDQKPEKIFSLKEDTQKLCEQRFGIVKKIVLYESNPEGVITVTYDNVEQADATVAALNGRIVAGREIKASNWDGKEKFKRQETEEERKRRENAWTEFLEESSSSSDEEEKQKDDNNLNDKEK